MGFSTHKHEKRSFIVARMENNDRMYRFKAKVALIRLQTSSRIRTSYDQLVDSNEDWIDMRAALASNGPARTALRKRVVRAIRRLARRNSELDFIFGSMIHAPWTTKSDSTRLDLADMQQRTRNVVSMCGFAGAIMMLEFQAEPGDRRVNDWPIHPNVHFIAWVAPGFDKRAAGRRVRRSNRLVAMESAKSIILSEKMKAGPDLWRRCCYLVKEPSSGKKRHKVTNRFEKTQQGMHPAACLRMTEILSHVRLSELLMLTGEATVLRKRLLRPVYPSRSTGKRRASGFAPSVFRLWDAIRATDHHFYEPIHIRRTIRRPKPDNAANRAASDSS